MLESDSAVCVSVFVEHHEMTIVDYVSAVGQWSSPPTPARGLFYFLLCERVLLEPLACGRGGPGVVCVCVLPR